MKSQQILRRQSSNNFSYFPGNLLREVRCERHFIKYLITVRALLKLKRYAVDNHEYFHQILNAQVFIVTSVFRKQQNENENAFKLHCN